MLYSPEQNQWERLSLPKTNQAEDNRPSEHTLSPLRKGENRTLQQQRKNIKNASRKPKGRLRNKVGRSAAQSANTELCATPLPDTCFKGFGYYVQLGEARGKIHHVTR